MTARWEESLDALLDLYTFSGSPRGRAYIEGFAASINRKVEQSGSGPQWTGPGAHMEMPDRVRAAAFMADPFWIEPEMMTLWQAAAEGFNPEPLHEQDVMTDVGFVYLPRPYEWTDIHGLATTFRAFMWARTNIIIESGAANDRLVAPGMQIMLFHQVGDRDGYDTGTGGVTNDPALAKYGVPFIDTGAGISSNNPDWEGVGKPDGPGRWVVPYSVTSFRPGDLILDHVMPWMFGADYRNTGKVVIPVGEADEDGVRTTRQDPVAFKAGGKGSVHDVDPRNIMRPIQCLWRLMQQTIATQDPTRASKPFRRRWEKAGLDERKITVIRLRRPKTEPEPDAEPRSVDWQSRWVVRGFWRNQWFPSLSIHRQVWINPYIKGPADRPLVIRKMRVFDWSR